MGFLSSAVSAAGSIAGGLISKNANENALATQTKLQREFAQNGIQWRVADARKAGIHPLAALGVQTSSYTPQVIGDTLGSAVGDAFGRMGQGLSRPIKASQTQFERNLQDAQITRISLENEGQGLKNEILRQQLASAVAVSNTGLPPASPGSGSSRSKIPNAIDAGQASPFLPKSIFNPQALEPTASQPGIPQQEVGAINDYGFARTHAGYAVIPSSDVKEKIEDQMIPELGWAIRNLIIPAFGGRKNAPPKHWLPKGAKEWSFNPVTGEYWPRRSSIPFVDLIRSLRGK